MVNQKISNKFSFKTFSYSSVSGKMHPLALVPQESYQNGVTHINDTIRCNFRTILQVKPPKYYPQLRGNR